MLAPGRIPKPTLNRIYTDLMEILKQPDTHARIEAAGYLVNGITPDAFAKLIDRDMKKWGTVIREAGIKATDTE
jgi:tripartite-type tricarboxylate transporter receptor subunit TctC